MLDSSYIEFMASVVAERIRNKRRENTIFIAAFSDTETFALDPASLDEANMRIVQVVIQAKKVHTVIAVNHTAASSERDYPQVRFTCATERFHYDIEFLVKENPEDKQIYLKPFKVTESQMRRLWYFNAGTLINRDLENRINFAARGVVTELEMGQHEVYRFLKTHGFSWLKEVRHGAFWTDGTTRILVARTFGDVRHFRNLKSDVMRAVEARKALEAAKLVEEPKKLEEKKMETQKQPPSLLSKPIDLNSKEAEHIEAESKRVEEPRKKGSGATIVRSPDGRRLVTSKNGKVYEMKKYDKTTQDIMDERIIELFAERLPAKVIWQRMVAEGYKNSLATGPVPEDYIVRRVARLYAKDKLPKYKALPTPQPVAPSQAPSAASYYHQQIPPPNYPPAPSAYQYPQFDYAPGGGEVNRMPAPPPPTRMAPPPTPVQVIRKLPDAISYVLKAKEYSEAQKVRTLLMWVEDSGAKLPEAVLNILTEPALSDGLKVKMTCSLLEG